MTLWSLNEIFRLKGSSNWHIANNIQSHFWLTVTIDGLVAAILGRMNFCKWLNKAKDTPEGLGSN
jgi:putative alpha-1,2-mannosidase